MTHPASESFAELVNAATVAIGGEWDDVAVAVEQIAAVVQLPETWLTDCGGDACRCDEPCGDGEDLEPVDEFPDFCWRCDAIPASTDVGLCGDCHVDLVPSEAP